MNSGRVMNLRVTIPAESRRMNVGKDVIRILGKSGLYLRFAEERSEVYCNHAVCCGASHVL